MRSDADAPWLAGRRILFVANQDWYFLLHWAARARAIQAAGASVLVVAPPGERLADIRALGFETYLLALDRKGLNPLREIRAVLELVRLVRRLQPDLIHSLTIKPNLYAGVAARLLGLPQAASVTGLGILFTADAVRGWKLRLARVAALALYRFLAGARRALLLFENPDDRAELLRRGVIASERARVIPGAGVNLSDYAPPAAPPPEPPRFLFAGRLLREKGLYELQAAAELLRARGVVCEILVAGIADPGNPGAIPESVLAGWRSTGPLQFIGERRPEEMTALYRTVHAAVLPSYREGLPRFLLEAAACELPVIAFDAPGCREIVRDGVNGRLAPLRDIAALADAMQALAEDAALRRRLGRAGREIVEREFSDSIVLDQTFAVYRQLLGA